MKSLSGKQALPFELKDTNGELYSSSDDLGHWQLLVFHRHLGWPPCREHLSQLRQHEDRLKSLDVRVRVITFDADFLALAYVKNTNLTWPLLQDSQQQLYKQYGMTRGSWWTIYGLPSILKYLKLIFRGQKPGKPGKTGGNLAVMFWSIPKELFGCITSAQARTIGQKSNRYLNWSNRQLPQLADSCAISPVVQSAPWKTNTIASRFWTRHWNCFKFCLKYREMGAANVGKQRN